MNEQRELARAFLTKAWEDQTIAELALGDARLVSSVCFHAQQAVEKALKAVLTAHGAWYPRTHDIERLLDLVGQLTPDFEHGRAGLSALTVYAAEARYPEASLPKPSAEEAAAAVRGSRRALGLAERIVASAAPREEADADDHV